WAKPLLAPYKIPQGLTVVDELPRNALGKVVKREVVRVVGEMADAKRPSPPRSPSPGTGEGEV
ncbi:MAG: hypothetical protein KDD11_19105, partial [Acidobacteria bacterium]|nr:hypothetical protein [Acidobacteriota bacterium]